MVGEAGSPRDWIYQWHNPLPGWGKVGYKLEEWAQDKKHKLYTDGRFYDVEADDLETEVIKPESDEADEAFQRLKSVLAHYKSQQ